MSNFNSLFQTVDALDSRCVYAFTNTNNSRTFENQTYILHILAIRWEAQYRMEAQYRFPMRMTLFKSAITLMSLFKSAISLEKRNLKRLHRCLLYKKRYSQLVGSKPKNNRCSLTRRWFGSRWLVIIWVSQRVSYIVSFSDLRVLCSTMSSSIVVL